ncbi:AraC family transcriptional regulator [Catalinimonas alkaloidigena]|uniref:AraC family transcriptional regulator n=1 Tax=Catalinimonas alkaloidigena TaxID=1075417 RepID=UPI002406C0E3|nr:helix-turn-helix domain-containing protein [Catalinimonas alkaloidigena]MDF9795965.1 AraC family transcriptional regulator [Catalinimonas alkaloidigena]
MSDQLLEQIKPEQIIENRKVYSGEQAELCVYETYQEAELVNFGRLDNPVLLFMLNGKKVIHESEQKQHHVFDFTPGESLVMAPQELVQIDFPDASPDHPTRCLTLEIGKTLISDTLSQLQEELSHGVQDEVFTQDSLQYESVTDARINNAIHRICSYYTQTLDSTSRKLLISHTLQELIILMMQTKARHILLSKKSNEMPRMQHVVDYIMKHLEKDLSVEELAEKACMSKPTFYRYFKKVLGLSPVEFVNRKRMQIAKQLLLQEDKAVSDVCYAVGYNSTSHFIRSFKKQYGCTPKQYQKSYF